MTKKRRREYKKIAYQEPRVKTPSEPEYSTRGEDEFVCRTRPVDQVDEDGVSPQTHPHLYWREKDGEPPKVWIRPKRPLIPCARCGRKWWRGHGVAVEDPVKIVRGQQKAVENQGIQRAVAYLRCKVCGHTFTLPAEPA